MGEEEEEKEEEEGSVGPEAWKRALQWTGHPSQNPAIVRTWGQQQDDYCVRPLGTLRRMSAFMLLFLKMDPYKTPIKTFDDY